MDKKIQSRIMDIRKKHFDTIRFFADLEEGTFLVEDNDLLPEGLMRENCDILKELYSGSFVESKDQGKVVNLYERILQGTKEPIHMPELETLIHMKDREGNVCTFSIIIYLDTDDQGLVVAYVGLLHPLRHKEIEDREILDTFTNDKNPSIYIKRIAKFQAAHPEREYAYIQMDVRKFKYINETYGCDTGDEILNYISETLDVMCDEEHLHCRLTADLFQVVTYYNSREEILQFIDSIDARLCRYGDIKFTMSYGVSVNPGTSTAFRKNGDKAALARVQSKRTIMNKVVFYEDTLMKDVKKVGEIEEIEEEALKNGEFHVYLQPKYLYDKEHAKIIGAEALVRWIDKDGHFRSPGDFIPVFEENGFIYNLDYFMWESVCKLLRKWMDEGRPLIPISVNVSRTYLHKLDITKDIKGLVDKYQIPIEMLQLEITETTESAETLEYINKFKAAGFTLMMDDFGSGYSSLSMLKDTPFDVLKMDRFFLDECMENEHGKTIVSHVISMTNDLGLSLIAEGVETRDMADFLFDNGCDVSQGFYFSKPVPVDEFEHMKDKNYKVIKAEQV